MRSTLRGLARAILPRSARNWLRSPRVSLNWVWNELLHWAGRNRVEEIRPGWRLLCHPGAYPWAYRAQVDDPEQRLELDTFIRACRPEMVLFDLGAHFGLFALAALHYGGADARAVAVEPSGFACRMLRIQARLNGVTGRLTIIEAAVAERSGLREMVPAGVIAAGYFSAATAAYGPRERKEVRAVTVDDLAEQLGVWPTHMKIDVEGAEAETLRGARATLAREPSPELFVELHNAILRSCGGDPGQALDLLDAAGYRTYHLDGRPANRVATLGRDLVRVTARRSEQARGDRRADP